MKCQAPGCVNLREVARNWTDLSIENGRNFMTHELFLCNSCTVTLFREWDAFAVRFGAEKVELAD